MASVIFSQDAAQTSASNQAVSTSGWLTFGLVFLLMMVDYIDRQVIVSMFPALKAEFGWTDTQLGALSSVVALTVSLGALPIAVLVDRWSRTRSIMIMGTVWSAATMACGLATGYLQLFLARLTVGLGEAGYGPAGSALLASRFPARMHGFILGAFQAAGGIGSIIGVVLGGYITARWGWRAAFGVVGVPGLILALMFWFVPDYKTFQVNHGSQRPSLGSLVRAIWQALRQAPTALLVGLGGALHLAFVANMLTWLPSFYTRVHQLPQERAGAMTAMTVLAFSVGVIVWGRAIDRLGAAHRTRRLQAMAVLSLVCAALMAVAFGAMPVGRAQIAMIVLGGFFMGCTVGTVIAIVLDVIHPAFRATSVAFVALLGNLGMAIGPLAVGMVSDRFGLQAGLTLAPIFSVLAAAAFVACVRVYRADLQRLAAAQ
ncbi:MAG: MFS transporter [Hydrogenophaga sp.]|nr:MFS transporter [Hydrogenophaga sp.]